MSEQVVLKALEGPALQYSGGVNHGPDLVLREGVTQLGRAVKLNDGYRFPSDWVQVSSKHCKIFKNTQGPAMTIFVEDSSTNGTFINDEKLQRGSQCEINIGDILSLSVADGALRYKLTIVENDGKRPSQQELVCNGNKRQKVQDGLTMDDIVDTLQKEKEELRKNEGILNERIREMEIQLKKEQDEKEFLSLQVQQKDEVIRVSGQQAVERISGMEQKLEQAQQQTVSLDKQVEELQRLCASLKSHNERLVKQLEQQEVIHVVKYKDFKSRVQDYFQRVQEVQKEYLKKLGLDIDVADETQKEQLGSSEICFSGDNKNVDSVAATIAINSDKLPQSQQTVPSKNELGEVKRNLKMNLRSSAPSVIRETMDQQQIQDKVVVDATQAATVRQEGTSISPREFEARGVNRVIMEDEGQEVPATGLGFFMGLTNNQTIAESDQQY